ncbi:MAG: virulence protein RhuM/Fic/DOC family protein [Gammaproteobacteria bacterium]|nr:virulence protein RhuM/Fic/DOC family protein [Gammaproteobacteria bacterium]MDE0284553.1 virulence protein RhuM/Fic/DOC family protein [Gammaproteobacteria bacterium]
MKGQKNIKEIVIYQTKSGQIEFRGDFVRDTVWGNLNQIAALFGRDKSVISRHIKNIFKSQELEPTSVVAKIATTASDGKTYQMDHYNLDVILSVGYRVDSKQATRFRIWATKTLKQHLVKGYTINKKRVVEHYDAFMQAVDNLKKLLPADDQIQTQDALELVEVFANTWFSLDAYDTQNFPQSGATKKDVVFTADELAEALHELKLKLTAQNQATELFGHERSKNAIHGIVGNVFQSFGGQDLYPTVEEKAAHLLYFTVKNHPFTDGNKRSGAFAFVWFLRKTGILAATLTPEALTTLTLLVAESNPQDKDKIIGLILLLLQKKHG